MSCRLVVSPEPLVTWPRSSSAVSLFTLVLSECGSATFLAIRTPFTLYQGPEPIRSRALTPPEPVVLNYTRQVRFPAPAAAASI